MEFRKIYEATDRFDNRDEIQQLIRGRTTENYIVDEAELKAILDEATSAAIANPDSIPARLKRTWAAALLRDFKYSRRNYRFLKGVGLGGLYCENYSSSVKIAKNN